ncbi:mechanosensitive ion channel family protein [Consotaella salsifontis]|uniref:Mechanosensitive ion channel n=1 Tax=Consotaella salsifontis TaxID=1365950 RepID=A0A1T4SZ94_9HYPH|nr:mechanosensitive ion channel domain-containing protein [Consotaella salsifontis]SKA33479.1 Mechanosensitive ion channel [Consotaella salsifontis]
MDEADVSRLGRSIERQAENALDLVGEPGSLIQIAIIVGAFLLAWLLARVTHSALEEQARRIKGAPGILRIVVAFMRRLRTVYFVVLLWAATLAEAALGMAPQRFVSIALSLSLAYLVISVASRIVRNRVVARMITAVAWIIAALSILDLTTPVANALDLAAINIGAARISALLVLKLIAVIAFALWLANVVGRFLDRRVQGYEELTPTLRVLIGKLLKIGLIVVALAAALAGVGVDLTALTVLSGAIGLGLGFGLQKVVSNFISGIIILLDRSIKPGDTITVGETYGWIRELRARFVSVVTRDGKEYLIPNEDFITNQVVNWSFTDELVRIDVKFGVSYNSNPHDVIRVAKEAAKKPERVVSHKEPVCWMTDFGDSSLDFVLRFWIKDPPAGIANVRGQVLLALWDAFKENGIDIPFPHREVIFKTPLKVDRAEAANLATGEAMSPPLPD